MWDPVFSSTPAALEIARQLGQVQSAWVGLVVAGISAAVELYKAHKQSQAAKEAAATQVQGTKDAQGYIDKGYQQGQAALSPWLTTGGAAATTLGGLMGLPMAPQGSTSAPPAAPLMPNTPLVSSYKPSSAFGDVNPRSKALGDLYADDTTAWREDRRADRRAARLGNVMDPTSAEAMTQTGYTKMRAPDGTEEMIPAQQVRHYTALGAQVVG